MAGQIQLAATLEVVGNQIARELLSELESELEAWSREHVWFTEDESRVYMLITHAAEDAPFRVYSADQIALSTHLLEGHARYTGIGMCAQTFLFLHLAMMQRKALASNHLLKPEDLLHPERTTCLMRRPGDFGQYAFQLDDLEICPGCRDFYLCVGCENELLGLSKYRKLLKSGLQSA